MSSTLTRLITSCHVQKELFGTECLQAVPLNQDAAHFSDWSRGPCPFGLLQQNIVDWWLVNNKNLFLPVLEAWKSQVKELADLRAWREACFLVHRPSSRCPHPVDAVQKLPHLFYKAAYTTPDLITS